VGEKTGLSGGVGESCAEKGREKTYYLFSEKRGMFIFTQIERTSGGGGEREKMTRASLKAKKGPIMEIRKVIA